MIRPDLDYRSQLRRAIRAVEITSPFGFRWLDADVETVPSQLQSTLLPDVARALLKAGLSDRLYRCFYTQGGVARPERRSGPADGSMFARTADTTLAAIWPGPPFVRSAGYFTLERGLDRTSAPTELLRVYFDVAPSSAARLAGTLARALDHADIPYGLKFLDDPDQYDRCDTCLVYLRSPDLPGLVEALSADGSVHDALRPAVPAFTYPIAAGIGVAVDPRDGRSFGQHRCEIVAGGLIRSYDRHLTSCDGRLAVVEECFVDQRLRADAPYLSGGASGLAGVDQWVPLYNV